MLRSMTAFARNETHQDWGSAVWELRSVNHRYLDIFVRMPEELRGLEQAIRERAGARLRRGKLECNLRFKAGREAADTMRVNLDLAGQLVRFSREVDQLLFNAAPVSSVEVLRWPGVIESLPLDMEAVGAGVLELLDASLDELVATREREGETVGRFIEARLGEMQPLVDGVRQRLPEIQAGIGGRLRTRLAELRGEVDEHRLEQEVVLYAQKADVAEEIDRLRAHIVEVRRVLGEDRPVGRRLDFLMQEMNREANTLSSKSASTETTLAAVELKVIVEQIREQVQNIE